MEDEVEVGIDSVEVGVGVGVLEVSRLDVGGKDEESTAESVAVGRIVVVTSVTNVRVLTIADVDVVVPTPKPTVNYKQTPKIPRATQKTHLHPYMAEW